MVIKVKTTLINTIYIFNVIFILSKMLSTCFGISILDQIAIIVQAVASILCILYLIGTKKSINDNKIKRFIILMVLYELFVTFFNHLMSFPKLFSDIIYWPLLIIVFMNYVSDYGDIKIIKKTITFLYCLVCFLSIFLIRKHLSGYGVAGGVVFYTYYCIALIPLVLIFVDNKKLKNFFMILSIIILVVSTKRVGTIIAIGGFLAYILSNIHLNKNAKNRFEKYFILIILLFFVVSLGALYFSTSNTNRTIIDRFESLSSDGGSGRDYIWEVILKSYDSSPQINRIIGHGGQSVYRRLRPLNVSRFAHNSYIEYLYDYGIIGLILIIIFTLYILYKAISHYKQKSIYSPVLFYIFTVTIFLSLFSYFYEQSVIIVPISMALGYILGIEKRKKGDTNEI